MDKAVIIRTALLAFALINQMLTNCGYSPIPIDDAMLEQTISDIITIGASLMAFWYNNSFSSNAKLADKVLKQLNDGAISAEEIENIVG